MIRTFIFNNQGKLPGHDKSLPAVINALNDPNVHAWIDLEQPSDQEAREVLEQGFHFHPLSIEDCLAPDSGPKVEEYLPTTNNEYPPYLFIVLHAVDYNRHNGV